eukprot:SAG11_NODE_11480_length_758_cov_0.939302_2_plen_111_part_01
MRSSELGSSSAADNASLQCLWAGDGTLATACNESMVRVWDLQHDENYMLSLHGPSTLHVPPSRPAGSGVNRLGAETEPNRTQPNADPGIQRKSQADRITKIVYHKQRGMLA